MRVSIDTLRNREYLSPNEAALLYGRTGDVWKQRCRDGLIAGYPERCGTRTYLRLSHESIRAWIAEQMRDPVANALRLHKERHAKTVAGRNV